MRVSIITLLLKQILITKYLFLSAREIKIKESQGKISRVEVEILEDKLASLKFLNSEFSISEIKLYHAVENHSLRHHHIQLKTRLIIFYSIYPMENYKHRPCLHDNINNCS
jgi:PIN domain nuclease of toxin-antitoxin system